MKPSDLGLLQTVSAPAVAPDGSAAVVAVLHPDLDKDSYTGGLWMVPLRGEAGPRQLTHGFRDTAPAYSPDGQWLAFVRSEEKGKPQLHLLPTAGGDARKLTDAKLGVSGAPVWSPDSTRIAVTARIPEEGRYGTDEDVSPDAEPPRLITTNKYRRDGAGFLRDKPQHLLVVTLGEDEPVQVTDGPLDDVSPAWLADGSALVFASARHEGSDDDMLDSVFAVAPDGSDLRELVPPTVSIAEVLPSADGSTLWLLAQAMGETGHDFVAQTTGLWSVPADGSAPPTRHSDTEADDLLGPLTLDAGNILCLRQNRGAVELVRWNGKQLQSVHSGEDVVTGFGRADDGTLVATIATPLTAGEVRVLGEAKPRTDFGAKLRGAGLVPPAAVTTTSAYPVHGWVLKPEGEGPHPLLLFVHGGPYAQYAWSLMDEFQVAVADGYAVAYCNPRGSSGYGMAHGRAIRGAMGTVDADDVLAFLDHVCADDAIDADRVGVMGGSYGGYMTALLTTRTTRFAAAIVERGFLDPVSFAGTSDIGWSFGTEYCGTDPESVARQSPMAAVDKVTTPTLVVHSEQDWRCPVEQGQRWWMALKRQGVPTELLLFPGEGHELTRSGRPKHRVARFGHVQRWWAEHLPV